MDEANRLADRLSTILHHAEAASNHGDDVAGLAHTIFDNIGCCLFADRFCCSFGAFTHCFFRGFANIGVFSNLFLAFIVIFLGFVSAIHFFAFGIFVDAFADFFLAFGASEFVLLGKRELFYDAIVKHFIEESDPAWCVCTVHNCSELWILVV